MFVVRALLGVTLALAAPSAGQDAPAAPPATLAAAPASHDLRLAREAGLRVLREELDALLATWSPDAPPRAGGTRRAALALGLAGLVEGGALDPADRPRVARALELWAARPAAPRGGAARTQADELGVLATLLAAGDSPHWSAATLGALAGDRVRQLAALRAPDGGWGPPAAPADAETTAHVVTALARAAAAGVPVSAELLAGALAGLRRARLGPELVTATLWPLHSPSADTRLLPAASVARVQSVHRALRTAGADLPADDVLRGLDAFYQHHRFLDLALGRKDGRPGLHGLRAEQYLAAHLDAARLLEVLSRAERARYVGRLAVDVLATRRADGSFVDGVHGGHGRLVGTARAVLTLQALLDA